MRCESSNIGHAFYVFLLHKNKLPVCHGGQFKIPDWDITCATVPHSFRSTQATIGHVKFCDIYLRFSASAMAKLITFF